MANQKKKKSKISRKKRDLQIEKLQQTINELKKARRLDQIKLRLYKEIGGISRAKFSYEDILHNAMDLALKALGTDAGTLFTLDPLTQELVFTVVKGPQKTIKKLQRKRISWGVGIVGHVVKTQKPYRTDDALRDRKWQKKISEDIAYKTQDVLCVPLHDSRGNVQGALQLINRKKAKKYDREDLDVLTSISVQLGIVMENARLFEMSKRRLKALTELHDISALLTSRLDRFDVRKEALAAVIRLMNCQTGSLYQVDSEKNELFFDVVLNDQDEEVKKNRLKMGEGIAGWVAKHKKSVLVSDCEKDKRFSGKVDKASHFKTKNMLCAPLVFQGEVLGVLQAINRNIGTFSDEDLTLFEDLANQVSIALKNALLFEDLRRSFYESVSAFAEAIELRDPYTGGHTQRVRKYSMAIGRQMALGDEEIERISLSAILHDIGKIGVADNILKKKGKLDYEEFLEMKKHPELGYKILKGVSGLSLAYDGILYHHERFDGKGYPKGLKGEEIPLIARIIAVADTFDAMTTNRPYRDRLSLDFVLKELRDCAGTQFDRKAVKAFLKDF